MTWIELVVGFALIVTACSIVGRPRYQSSRLMMGMSGAALFVGVIGVAAGVAGLTAA